MYPEGGVIQFQRVGPKVMVVQKNLRFRAGNGGPGIAKGIDASFPDSIIASSVGFEPRTKGTLNELDLTAIYNHPSGFFVEGEGLWFGQSNAGYISPEPGDNFWQWNAFLGYRTPGRNLEASIGILNITNRGYNLNPLNIYNELPLTRTLGARLQINF